jgi:hypothetical protein
MRDSVWINLLISIWLIIAAFFLVPPSITRAWNEILFGSLLMIVSGWLMVEPRSRLAASFEIAIGAWLIASPFVLSYRAATGRLNDIICGIVTIVITVGAWQAATRPTRLA